MTRPDGRFSAADKKPVTAFNSAERLTISVATTP
jgi:hypothetical protein